MRLITIQPGWRAAVMLCGLAISSLAASPATLPAGRFEDVPVRGARQASPTTTSSAGAVAPIDLSWARVAWSLAIVLALILALRWAMRRWISEPAGGAAARAVRVLGRTLIAPRQQIVLLQVGRRIIVAADCGGQLTSLTQIADADEVAALIGQLDSSLKDAPTGSFVKWFGKAMDSFDESVEWSAARAGKEGLPEKEDPSIAAARGELAELADRIRGLRKQFKP